MRRALLTAHVVSSVGWVGAVAAFLALDIVALTTERAELARGMYAAMNVTGLYVIVPASLLAVLTGVAQGAITQWGLWRHRWVATKLVLGIGATVLLLLHQFTAVATAAARAEAGLDASSLGRQLVVDASLAIVVLLVSSILSVFKPWGLTRHGRRLRDKPEEPRMAASAKIGLAVAIAAVVVVAVLHLTGHGMQH